MKRISIIAFLSLVCTFLLLFSGTMIAQSSSPTYNINTLAGKVASVNGTADFRFGFRLSLRRSPTSATISLIQARALW